MQAGGGEAGLALNALRRSTETALRSTVDVSTGASRSRRSEFCRRKVPGRGSPGTTLRDSRRPKGPGLAVR